MDRQLARHGLPPLAERFAVLAYGSNACPGQLMQKYRDHGLTDVPVLYGRLEGATAVYAKRFTQKGYIPATLARKKGNRSSWVNLLTAEQLNAMDLSEGRGRVYELTRIEGVRFVVGRKHFAPLYSYVSIRNGERGAGVMVLNSESVNLHAVSQKRARLVFAKTAEQPAADWLSFEVIRNPDPPQQHSVLQR